MLKFTFFGFDLGQTNSARKGVGMNGRERVALLGPLVNKAQPMHCAKRPVWLCQEPYLESGTEQIS